MKNRRKIANWIGSLSLVLSLAFWLLLFLGSARRPTDREFFMKGLDALFYICLPIWSFSALLAVASGVLGSRRWLFATLAPFLSAWITANLLGSIPF
jgi:hypothetical protein